MVEIELRSLIKPYLYITSTLMLLISANALAGDYSLRKYPHVTEFYKSLAQSALELGLQNNVPPAAILAIAGLESGYGRGYVSRITGNVLSLGARKGEPELPPLYLPTYIKTNRVLIDKKKIESIPASELKWKKRPPSLKKDYRPQAYAGTTRQLEILQNDVKLRVKARKHNIDDFVSSWIDTESAVPVFADARNWLEQTVESKGKAWLLSCKSAKAFINKIGGKPRSFNHRKSWVNKVSYILDNGGLCELSQLMFKGKSFDDAWNG